MWYKEWEAAITLMGFKEASNKAQYSKFINRKFTPTSFPPRVNHASPNIKKFLGLDNIPAVVVK